VITKTHQLIHVRVTVAVHEWLYAESGRRETSVCTLVREAINDAIEAATGRPMAPIKATESYSNAPRNLSGRVALVLPLAWTDAIRELALADEMSGSHWTGAAVARFMAKTTGAEVATVGQKVKATPEEKAAKQRAWKKKHDDKRRAGGYEPATVSKRMSAIEVAAQRHAAFVSMCEASSRWPTGTDPAMWGGV